MPIDNTIRETYPNHIQEREDREQNSNAGYNMDQLALPLPDDTDFELFFEETDSENDLETVDDDSDDDQADTGSPFCRIWWIFIILCLPKCFWFC